MFLVSVSNQILIMFAMGTLCCTGSYYAVAVSQTAYKCSAVTFRGTAVTFEGRGVKLLLLQAFRRAY
jgi:hypothetical protein